MAGRVPGWRGVWMRDALPPRPRAGEAGVLNLDSSDNPGTHWTAWRVAPKAILYFDSYGCPPPKEFVTYLRSIWTPQAKPLHCSTMAIQRPGDPPFCGHLCVEFLKRALTPPLTIPLLELREAADKLRHRSAGGGRPLDIGSLAALS